MLHAPTTESKQQNDVAGRVEVPHTQRPLHPSHVNVCGLEASLPPGPWSNAEQLRRQPSGLQQIAGNQAVLRMLSRSAPTIQSKLTINQPGDQYEQEADGVAEQVMRMPDPSAAPNIHTSARDEVGLQRKCAECEEEEQLHRKPVGAGASEPAVAPPIVHEVLNSPGQPLDQATHAFFEPRFGRDFSHVRVHTDEKAAQSSRAIRALAYTVGRDIVFDTDRYAPSNPDGLGLISHELAHIVQQDAATPTTPKVQRQGYDGLGGTSNDADAEAEREYAGTGAPKATKCAIDVGCPPGFCAPYSSQKLAEYYRSKDAWWLLAGISAAVSSRVLPLWREYLWGGSPPKNLSAEFGKDFTNSPTTAKATHFLYDELKKNLNANPPSVPGRSKVMLDLRSRIPTAISALDNPTDSNRMNFNKPRDIPGNIAGDIGKDQTSCPAGAQPSPFNDERDASGTVTLEARSDSALTVTPTINYTVKDTIDLCPGGCGTQLEQFATVPLSQFEATGISGDVPFIVDFPAPSLDPFIIPTPAPAAANPASSKKP
jgi:Domain of unknown function (DUF4157)